MRKKTLIGLLPPFIILLVIAAIVTTVTYTWIAMNTEVGSNGTDMSISGTTYDLLIPARATTYNSYDGISTLQDDLETAGYDYNTNITTAQSAHLACELVNEFMYEDEYYLMPGAYGYLTFYIKPHDGVSRVDTNIHITLDGLRKTYVNLVLRLVAFEHTPENEERFNMLKGHFLFFTERTGNNSSNYKYSGLIEDGVLSYSTNGQSLSTDPGYTDCYKITLYWVWPVTYQDIYDNLTVDENDPKKYPSSLGTYVDDNRNYFFKTNAQSNDNNLLNDGYNEGDQLIGDSFHYIVVYLDASE